MKKIAKDILLILILGVVVSCSPDDEMIKKQIISKKDKIAQLNKQINDLKKQLTDTSKVEEFVPVRVEQIQPRLFNHYIVAFGEVEAEKYAQVMPEMPGRIKNIHINEGQAVSQGQLLVSLNTESMQNNIEQIKANLELAAKTFEKQKNLWEQNIGSEMQFLQAKTTKESLEAQLKATEAQLRMSQIRAPFAGYVDKIFQKEGELATQMIPVLEMVNMKKLSITVDISEKYIGDIKEGQMVEVSFSSLPEIDRNVPVNRVSRVIDKANRTFEVEVILDNEKETIKPHMVSTIRINDFSAEDAFVIPSLVIKNDITGNYVYVLNQSGDKTVAQKKYITTGLSYEDETLVAEGLGMGDRVITEGFNLVSSGIPVKVQ